MRGLIGRRLGGSSTAQYGVRLIQPGAIAGGGIVTFSRAQAAGAVSTAFAADGVTLQEYAADVPRFNGTARRMLFGGQRTNGIRNPRFEGGSTGTPGVYPTNMNVDTDGGLTRTIVGFGVEFGMSYMDVQWAGTSSSSFVGFRPDSTIVTAATVGQVWTGSLFARMVGGTAANIGGFRTIVFARDSGGTTLNTYPGVSTPLTASLARHSLVTSALPDAATAFVSSRIDVTMISGAAINITVRFYALQLEIGSFASTPILPPIGTPGASTRGVDNFTSVFSALFPTGVGTVLGSFMLPSIPTTIGQIIIELSDETAANRFRIRQNGSSFIDVLSVAGGVLSGSASFGNMTQGALERIGLTFDGTTITANLNGGTNAAITGQPSVLTTLRVGNDYLGATPTFGECGVFDALPYVIPPANLPAAVAAIPS